MQMRGFIYKYTNYLHDTKQRCLDKMNVQTPLLLISVVHFRKGSNMKEVSLLREPFVV